MTIILDGKSLSKKIIQNLHKELESMAVKPKLCVIQVGENSASTIYVNKKHKISQEIGIDSVVMRLNEDITEEELLNILNDLNKDSTVTGILVQLPLPKHINEHKIIEAIDYKKDVDGFSTYNIAAIAQGKKPLAYPCTPKGIIELLKEYDVILEGANAVVLGRSNIVGRPLASMLLNENATVTICHSKTKNLKEITKNADILISAIGKPEFVKGEMIKQGACVIDVGINRLADGKIVGDVAFDEAKQVVKYITPVPGGVGPMTIAMLMKNTVELFKKQNR